MRQQDRFGVISLEPVAEDIDEEIGGAGAARDHGGLSGGIEREAHTIGLCLIACFPVDCRCADGGDTAGIDGEVPRVDGVDDCDIGEYRCCVCGNEVRVCYCTGGDVALRGDGKQSYATRGDCSRRRLRAAVVINASGSDGVVGPRGSCAGKLSPFPRRSTRDAVPKRTSVLDNERALGVGSAGTCLGLGV